ncbi:MAG: hypothetical protein SNG27_09020 [Rikenellaceae bacterium]
MNCPFVDMCLYPLAAIFTPLRTLLMSFDNRSYTTSRFVGRGND